MAIGAAELIAEGETGRSRTSALRGAGASTPPHRRPQSCPLRCRARCPPRRWSRRAGWRRRASRHRERARCCAGCGPPECAPSHSARRPTGRWPVERRLVILRRRPVCADRGWRLRSIPMPTRTPSIGRARSPQRTAARRSPRWHPAEPVPGRRSPRRRPRANCRIPSRVRRAPAGIRFLGRICAAIPNRPSRDSATWNSPPTLCRGNRVETLRETVSMAVISDSGCVRNFPALG